MIDSRWRLEYYGREFLTDRDGLPGREHKKTMHITYEQNIDMIINVPENYILNECWNTMYSVALGLQVSI